MTYLSNDLEITQHGLTYMIFSGRLTVPCLYDDILITSQFDKEFYLSTSSISLDLTKKEFNELIMLGFKSDIVES